MPWHAPQVAALPSPAFASPSVRPGAFSVAAFSGGGQLIQAMCADEITRRAERILLHRGRPAPEAVFAGARFDRLPARGG